MAVLRESCLICYQIIDHLHLVAAEPFHDIWQSNHRYLLRSAHFPQSPASMLLLPVLIHPVDDALTLRLVIVAPVLPSPFQHLVPGHAEMIEQVRGMHHVVVVSARSVDDVSLGEHLFDDRPCLFSLCLMRAHGRLLATLAVLCVCRCVCCRSLVVGDDERLCVEIQHRISIMRNATEPRHVATLSVVRHATQVSIILVALPVGRPVQDTILRTRELRLLRITEDGPGPLAADAAIGQYRVRVACDLAHHLFQPARLHVVYVADGKSRHAYGLCGLFANTIEQHSHREGRHDGTLHLLVGLFAGDVS